MPRRIIIDTDPGIDDAVAILLALAADELEVLGIIAVAGNLPLAQTERNARRVCELAGRPDVPVFAGCARPILRPHAAAIVVDSGMPITMIPLDVTHQVLSTPPRLAALHALGNRCGPAVAALLDSFEINRRDKFGVRSMALHDPSVIGYLLRPGLYEGREVNVAIETQSPLTVGMTVVDWWGVTGRKANAQFMNTVDADGF